MSDVVDLIYNDISKVFVSKRNISNIEVIIGENEHTLKEFVKNKFNLNCNCFPNNSVYIRTKNDLIIILQIKYNKNNRKSILLNFLVEIYELKSPKINYHILSDNEPHNKHSYRVCFFGEKLSIDWIIIMTDIGICYQYNNHFICTDFIDLDTPKYLLKNHKQLEEVYQWYSSNTTDIDTVIYIKNF